MPLKRVCMVRTNPGRRIRGLGHPIAPHKLYLLPLGIRLDRVSTRVRTSRTTIIEASYSYTHAIVGPVPRKLRSGGGDVQNGAHARGIGRFCSLCHVWIHEIRRPALDVGGGGGWRASYIYANVLKLMFLLDLGTSVGVTRCVRPPPRPVRRVNPVATAEY